jgi:hypothetical protein
MRRDDGITFQWTGVRCAAIYKTIVIEVAESFIAMPIQNLTDPEVFRVMPRFLMLTGALKRRIKYELERFATQKVSGPSRGIVVRSAVLPPKIAVEIVISETAFEKPFRSTVSVGKTAIDEIIIMLRCPAQRVLRFLAQISVIIIDVWQEQGIARQFCSFSALATSKKESVIDSGFGFNFSEPRFAHGLIATILLEVVA